MATLLVRHNVSDFDSWKRAYDEFDEERRGMGVIADGVYQSDGNPNEVTVFHDFETMDAARSFAGSDRLREVMKSAGVEGQPSIWFARRV